MIDQKVWLAARATSYTVVCEECAAEHGYLGAPIAKHIIATYSAKL